MSSMAEKWNNIYSKQSCDDAVASSVLSDNVHLLPENGKALDLACGLGGNAILLAENELHVEAWDVSNVALEKLSDYSKVNHLSISTQVRDVENTPPEEKCFDVITVTQFLHRPSFSSLIKSLKSGGLLFYQTFCVEKVDDIGPSNPKYLLAKNELLTLCEGMEVLVYREEGQQGNTQQGWRNQAMIIAKKI